MFACFWNTYKLNSTEYNILHMAYFTKHNVFKIHPYILCNSYVLFLGSINLCEYHILGFFSSVNEYSCVSYFEDIFFNFFGEVSRSGIAG